MRIIKYFERPYKSWFPKDLNRKIEKLDSIEVDIVSHCNLNCKSCTHFSPIAKPWYIDINDFKNDVTKVSELLTDEKVGRLYILGGEPLLHHQISEILRIARDAYRRIPIIIITNGFLLPKMDEEFWRVCAKENIEIEVTRYPVSYDYSQIKRLAEEMKGKVKIVYKGRTRFMKKKQYMLPIDVGGKTA